jgi:hypothetical protein
LSVFHEVPHVSCSEVARFQVEAWEYVELQTTRDLHVVPLTNPQLRQRKLPRRADSLLEAEIIHTPASQCPRTRTWAKFLYDHISTLDGLAWRPRLAGQDAAYVFFGARCGPLDFAIVRAPVALTPAAEYAKIRAVAVNAHIQIIDGR